MSTRLFHLLCRDTKERVRAVDGEGHRSYPEMVIYNPPDGWEWSERHLFRPARGDVLEISDTLDARGERLYTVPYIGEDLILLARVYERSTFEITAATANEQALEVMRLRMRDWLDDRDEWAQASGILSEPSHTSMAACVAPWLADRLDQAVALCARAGWPSCG